MKILLGDQIREADLQTIEREPIESIDLMERAASEMAKRIMQLYGTERPMLIVAGKGNNGGDGLAIARILSQHGCHCSVYSPFGKDEMSADCAQNLSRLPDNVEQVSETIFDAGKMSEEVVIIDTLLGSGVRGRVKAPLSGLIAKLNLLPNTVVAIDLPSGMKTEFQEDDALIVNADATLTVEFPKLGMLLPDAGNCCGDVHIVPIGLNGDYVCQSQSRYSYLDRQQALSLIEKRTKFAYKNKFGHLLLVCGSSGMSGAATLSTMAALRSGCGLVTTHLPWSARCGVEANCPSAMMSFDDGDYFTALPHQLAKYSAIGIGCGLGQAQETVAAFGELLSEADCPMVIDADALNILATNRCLIEHIPQGSILTPHLGELRRLMGEWSNEEDKLNKVRVFAQTYKVIVVVKGAHTMVCMPDGECCFNSTGNAGMAKGGSGDVLTGLLAGLLARGYDPDKAALLGVYIHGLAGDMAAKVLGQEAMNSLDLMDYLPQAYRSLEQ